VLKDNDDPIIVIGAGSTGTSAAHHIAKRGQRVVLIDKNQIASGMTSRSSAIVRTHYSNELVARMALYSMNVFKNFDSIGDSGFVKSGMLILVPKELREGTMENAAMLNRVGATNLCLDIDEAKKMFPEIDYNGIDFVDYEPESGYADSVGVATGYAKAAQNLGAELRLEVSVKKLIIDNGKVRAVLLDDGTHISCSRVVLCTNIWTNKLLRASGYLAEDEASSSFPLWAAAHPIVVFKRPKEIEGMEPIIWDYPAKIYSKPEGQSLCFVGSLDPSLDKIRADPDSYPNEVSFDFVTSFAEAMSRRIPAMKAAEFHSSYVGVYDLTPDQHPIMDELSSIGLQGVYCCVGLSGHGFKLCPALGLMISEMVLGAVDPVFDRSLFSLERFRTGKLIHSRHENLATIA
jgi:sarcosine oxidase, subunit beta